MKEIYQSLIFTVAFFLLGLLMILIGHIRGTYYGVLIFTYISAIFFLLSLLLFLSFLYELFHKDFKVHKPKPEPSPEEIERWDKF